MNVSRTLPSVWNLPSFLPSRHLVPRSVSGTMLNLHQVWRILELVGTFTCTWPANTNAGTWKIVLRNIRWIFTLINLLLLAVFVAFDIHHNQDNIVAMMKAITEMGCVLEVILDLVMYKTYSARLQTLVRNVKTYMKAADEHETNVLQSYVDRYKKFFSTIAFPYVSNGFSFTILALCTKGGLPVDGWIPFSLERIEIYSCVFFVQSYSIFQISFSIFADFMIVGLLCYIAARLDILGEKLKEVTDYDLLTSCIKEHQEIIGFFEDTKAAVQTLLFKTNITMGGTVISAVLALLYVRNQSLVVASQFLFIVLAGCGHIYIITWPANDLKESSLQFARSLSDIRWIGKSREMKSAVLIMMLRSQKPFLIPMTGLLPVLSLEYFSQFMSSVFSYFMTMRSMLEL